MVLDLFGQRTSASSRRKVETWSKLRMLSSWQREVARYNQKPAVHIEYCDGGKGDSSPQGFMKELRYLLQYMRTALMRDLMS